MATAVYDSLTRTALDELQRFRHARLLAGQSPLKMGDGNFANRAMATAQNGWAHLLPFVQTLFLWLAFGFRLDSRRYRRLVAATEGSSPLPKARRRYRRLVAATEDLPRTDLFPKGPSRIQSALILQFCERYLNFRRT
jgi:hypothetical protein